jgi:hypothetical protein
MTSRLKRLGRDFSLNQADASAVPKNSERPQKIANGQNHLRNKSFFVFFETKNAAFLKPRWSDSLQRAGR